VTFFVAHKYPDGEKYHAIFGNGILVIVALGQIV
jgi:hypothetical protein